MQAARKTSSNPKPRSCQQILIKASCYKVGGSVKNVTEPRRLGAMTDRQTDSLHQSDKLLINITKRASWCPGFLEKLTVGPLIYKSRQSLYPDVSYRFSPLSWARLNQATSTLISSPFRPRLPSSFSPLWFRPNVHMNTPSLAQRTIFLNEVKLYTVNIGLLKYILLPSKMPLAFDTFRLWKTRNRSPRILSDNSLEFWQPSSGQKQARDWI